jgi:hypothetical protein
MVSMEFKRYFSKLSNDDAEDLLRRYALTDDYDMAIGGLRNFINMRELGFEDLLSEADEHYSKYLSYIRQAIYSPH